MRRVCVVLAVLGLSPGAGRSDEPERPVLVIDADGHTAAVRKVVFTTDGKELISVSDDKTARVWDVAGGEPLRVLRPPVGPGAEGRLLAAAVASDGRTLAVAGFGRAGGEQPIFLIGLDSGRIERRLVGHTDAVLALAFAPDGRRLASGSVDATARVWDADTGACRRVFAGHTRAVFGVAYSPDGTRLATASFDATGRVWDIAAGKTQAVLRGHTREVYGVAWRPDGRVIATSGADRAVRLWGPDGSAFRGAEGLDNEVSSVTFTPDSRALLITWGGSSTTNTGKSGAALLDSTEMRERVRFTRHTNSVLSGTLAPGGALAATAGGNDREIFLWETADASPVHRLVGRGRTPWSAAWGPDGATIAWGNTNRGDTLRADMPLERSFRLSTLEFVDAPDSSFVRARMTRGARTLVGTGRNTLDVREGGRTLATLAMESPLETVHCATLLAGDRVAVGTSNGLYLFDARTGGRFRTFVGHNGTVWAVAPSPDGRLLLSASGDQTLRVWDPGRDEPLVSLFVAGDDWVAWTPEGYYAASPGGERLVGWHVNRGPDRMAEFFPAAQFRKRLYRPDVVRLLLRSGGTARALEAADAARGRATEKTEVAAVLPPEVEVAAPRSGARVTEPKLEVRALARARGPHPVTALRLLLDGRPYRGQEGVTTFSPPRSGAVRVSWAVTLEPGAHTLAVQADSDVSQALSAPVDVAYAAAERTDVRPSLYVLAVGVSAYPGALRLNYAASDAEAVARAFRGKSAGLFRTVEERRLTDAEASRRAVLAGLTWLRRQMTQRDVAVVFFSGHGLRDSEGSLFLLPVDGDPDDLLATAVADDQLKKALAGLPGRVIALLDACHAGALGGDRRKGVGGLTDDLVRDLVTDDYGVIVMASSMGREESQEDNAHRGGAFTVALTEGLAGRADLNGDGVVYLNELDAYVTDRVKELTKGRQHPVTAKPTSIRSFPLARP